MSKAATDAYRTSRMDPRIFDVPEHLLQQVAADPESHIATLVDALVRDVSDGFLVVKRLHDWIAEHIAYDCDAFYGDRPIGRQGWTETLRGERSVCEGYASLFQRMCELAGVECVKISGYGRGVGFCPFDEQLPEESDHAWNAVRLGGDWHLIDVTWDAGSVNNRCFEKRYSTDYLYLDPLAFAHTHYPTDSQWQLLENPLSPSDFLSLPRLRGAFFHAGLSFEDPVTCSNRSGDEAMFRLHKQDGVYVSAHISDDCGNRASGCTFVQNIGQRVLLYTRFPTAGRWEFTLFAKTPSDEAYHGVATLGFDADASTDRGFPDVFESYHEVGAALLKPLIRSLPTNDDVTLRICVPGVRDVQLVTPNGRWFELRRDLDDYDVWHCTFGARGAGPHRIVAKVDPTSSRYAALVEFQ
jgi:hypothetical protein